MAKIVRSTQKIFGANAAQNQVTEFGSIKAGGAVYSKNVNDIQTEAFEGGWSDALQDDYAPYRQDRNALDFVTTSQLAYLFQEGVPEWDSGTMYYKGAIVKVIASNGAAQLYVSLADNNTYTFTNTSYWSKFLDTSIPFAKDADVVKLTGNQTIRDTKTFTSAVTRSHEFTGGSSKTVTDIDTNGKGSIAIIPYYTGNNVYHRTYAENTTAGKHAYFDVMVNDNGNAALQFGGTSPVLNVNFQNAAAFNVPTPATNDSSTKAATTANVDAKITAQAVKLTGDQTIGGNKTFTGIVGGTNAPINFIAQNNNIQKGVTPTANQYVGYDFRGAGGARLVYLGVRYGVDGTKTLDLQQQDTNITHMYSSLPIKTPTPATGENSTTVPTTAWVNSRLGGTGITSTEISYLDGVSSNIQTQLNGKANTSASNFNATGKSTILGWGIPNYSAGIDILSSASAGYTVPKKGVVVMYTIPARNTSTVTINNNVVAYKESTGGDYSFSATLLVEANDVIKVSFVSGGSIKFFPLKGA